MSLISDSRLQKPRSSPGPQVHIVKNSFVKKESMPSPLGIPQTQQTAIQKQAHHQKADHQITHNKVVLATNHYLPGHLIRALAAWHQDQPQEPPCASQSKKVLSTEDKYFSRDSRELPGLKEITILKPSRYNVYYFPVPDAGEAGVLIKFVPYGNRRHFLKKWLGNYKFQAEPIAVRLSAIDGAFPLFPDDHIWETVTARKIPTELKDESSEDPQSGPPNKIRRIQEREKERESTTSSYFSVSSSGSDILPQMMPAPSSASRRRRSSRHARLSEGLSVDEHRGLDGEDEMDENEDEDEDKAEDEDQDQDNEALPTGLTNGGLPIISHLQSHTNQTQTTKPPLLPSGSKKRPPTRKLTLPWTASDLGAAELRTSLLANFIKIRFLVPRTKISRDLRIEKDEKSSQYLFDEATAFFRKYDRPLEAPVLECVIEGEPDCRCAYNAEELGYFLEDIRGRRGIVSVIVTQGF